MKFSIPLDKLQASNSLKDLLAKLFKPEEERPSAADIFDHPWVK